MTRALTLALVLLCFGAGAATVRIENQVRNWVEKGNSLYSMGLYDEAGRCYAGAIEIDPQSDIAFYNLGNVYHQKYLESLKASGASKDPAAALAWQGKAVGAYKRAMASSSPTLKARALFNLGNTYAVAGQIEEAIQSYEESLLLVPNDFDTKHNLERLLRRSKQPTTTVASQQSGAGGITNSFSRGGMFGGKAATNVVSSAGKSGGKGDRPKDEAGMASGDDATDSDGTGAGQAQDHAGGGTAGASAGAPGAGGDGGQASGAQPGQTAAPGGASAQNSAANPEVDPSKTTAQTGATRKARDKKDEDKDRKDRDADQAQADENSDDDVDPEVVSFDEARNKNLSRKKGPVDSSGKSAASNPSANAGSAKGPSTKNETILDAASRSEQRFIDSWSRPPDFKKPPTKDW